MGACGLSLCRLPCAVCCGADQRAVPYVVRLFRKHLYEYVIRLVWAAPINGSAPGARKVCAGRGLPAFGDAISARGHMLGGCVCLFVVVCLFWRALSSKTRINPF